MSASKPLLWHIWISHYSEKARWALDFKRVPHRRRAMPGGFHMIAALALTHGEVYTFPILELDGEVISDSTEIIGALERRHPEPSLYPKDPVERRRALDLEDYFDEELGAPLRLLGFHEMVRDHGGSLRGQERGARRAGEARGGGGPRPAGGGVGWERIPRRRPVQRRRPHCRGALLSPRTAAAGPRARRSARRLPALPGAARGPARLPVGRGDVPRVSAARKSRRGRPCLTRRAYLHDRLDLDRDVEGELGRADSRARVIAGLSPHVEYQLREAIDHRGSLAEAGRAVDEPECLHPPRDPVQIAQLLLQRCEDREAGEAGGLVGLLDRHVGVDLSLHEDLLAVHGQMARDIGEPVTDANELEGKLDPRRRREGPRESQPELAQPVLDGAHGRTIARRLPRFRPRPVLALRR